MRNHIVEVTAMALAVAATSLALAQAWPPATDSASDRAVGRELRELPRIPNALNQ